MAVDWDTAVIGPTIAVFGEAVTYRPKSGASFGITGVFDEGYSEVVLVQDEAPDTTQIPVLGVQVSAFPTPPVEGDRLSVARTNETYIVKEVRFDGHGHAKLMLNFVSSP